MIDYEKLKLAHELSEKLNIDLTYAYLNKDGQWVYWVGLNQLLLELSEMQKDTYKFKEGQKVWYNHPLTNKPVEDEILDIKVKPNDEIQYQFAHYAMMECDVYACENDVPRVNKYKLNDTVWFFLHKKDFDFGIIESIDESSNEKYLVSGGYWVIEDEIYPSREALIKSQIEHWHSLLNPEIDEIAGELKLVSEVGKCPDCGSDMADYWGKLNDGSWSTGCSKRCGHLVQIKEKDKCEHESDGYCYATYPIQYKCKKCGEFYR